VLQRCAEAEVPCGPVYSIDEIFDDEQYAARGNILKFQDERVGTLAIPNVVPRLNGTPGKVNWLGPKLGSHTDEVLRDVLALDAEKIQRLKEKGIV